MLKVKILLLFFISISLLLINNSPVVFADSKEEAENATKVAQTIMTECYEVAAEAQETGANITTLINKLNRAGDVYSKALSACKNGNYRLAVELANESQNILENFVDDANDLKEEAVERSHWDFMVNVVGSSVGSVLVIALGFGLWSLLKRKYAVEERKMKIEDYQALFFVVTFVTALLVASPALSRLLIYPRTEFFTELWILDSNHRAENYPFNITRNQNYTIYLGIGNHLGNCAYYLVEVKFRNESQSVPSSFGPIENRTPSSLQSLYSISAFVADEQVLEMPITFSFDYTHDENVSRLNFQRLKLNDATLDISTQVVEWNSTKKGFYGFLFFELWLYNRAVSRFEYHGRFVGLWLNMTASL